MPENKKLEELVNEPLGSPQNEQTQQPQPEQKPESIDQVVQPEKQEGLEKAVSEEYLNSKTSIFRKILDIGLITGAMYLEAQLLNPVSALLFGAAQGTKWVLSSLIPMFGYAVGSYFDNRKKGVPNTWKRLRREIYSGNLIGLWDYAIFSTPEVFMKLFPEMLSGATFKSKIFKTLMFNPLMVVPYNMVYQAFTYARDYIGWGNLLKRTLTLRVPSTIKEIYKNAWKKELPKDTWNVFRWLFPLHFIQVNYIPDPTLRMLQSLFVNNPIYRYVMGRSEREKVLKEKQTQQPQQYPQNIAPLKQQQTPEYSPSPYQTAPQQQHRRPA